MANNAVLDKLQKGWCEARKRFTHKPIHAPAHPCPYLNPAPAAPPGSPPTKRKHSAAVDEIADNIALSPTLKKNLEKLQKENWTIRYGGRPGDLPGSYTDKGHKTIVIDPAKKGDPDALTQTLSHESGHALYNAGYTAPDGQTRDEYVKHNTRAGLMDEGEATLTNAQIRSEIKANCGGDIGIAGQQGAKYAAIASKYPDPKDRDTARGEIADVFAKGENPSTSGSQNYEQYYSGEYNKLYDKYEYDNFFRMKGS